MDNLSGKTLGQYQIVSLAGKGGMATVYKAYQPSLNRHVALKVLPEVLAEDAQLLKRFRQEALAAAALRHPNIVVIHDVGRQGNLHYIAMEYLEGRTLADILEREGALPLPTIFRIMEQLASALDFAHQRKLIHRDIKPANIFLDANNHVTLMDFGIAKALAGANLTGAGMMIGTPEYMSPEQIAGQPVDARSDLYSLGIVLYQMLTGYVPFGGEETSAILFAQMNKPPMPPSRLTAFVTPQMEAVVLRALAKNPQERFASASQMFHEFAQAATGSGALGASAPGLGAPGQGAPRTPPPAGPTVSAPVPAPTVVAQAVAASAPGAPVQTTGALSGSYIGLWALVVGVGALGLIAVIVAVLLATGVIGGGGGLRGIGRAPASDTPTRRVAVSTATVAMATLAASATPLPPPTLTPTQVPPSATAMAAATATAAPTTAIPPTATRTRPAATATARPPTRPPATAAPTATPTADEPRTITVQSPMAGESFKSSVITFKWSGGALKEGESFVVQIIPTLSEKKGECMTEGDYGTSGYQYSPPLTTHEWTKDIMVIASGMTKPCAGRIEWRVHLIDAAGNIAQSTPRVHFVWNPL